MKLYNTLTKTVDEFKPQQPPRVTLYSCGPTVYDHIHIGNLSSFIYADTLRRVLTASDYDVKQVMNFTDVDDKTIRRSQEQHPELDPAEALKELTSEYSQLFLTDMEAIGNDVEGLKFVKATDSIAQMQKLIRSLYKEGFAYIADDGVYFSIEKYKSSGKKYGRLLELKTANSSEARINNDEYDKESIHDFSLWKLRKDNEPAWDFELDGHELLGRPGWHIECSAMSVGALGQPFDIHTGGVDLVFPHHENEIAQSTAGTNKDYANFFVHNEHLLVDGKKMSKSLDNFYTMEDVKERGFDPLALRLLVLQSHYRSQSNFTWENLEAAQNRLNSYRQMSVMRHQIVGQQGVAEEDLDNYITSLRLALENDLNTAQALSILSQVAEKIITIGVTDTSIETFIKFLELIDDLFGLQLSAMNDISDDQKQMIVEREKARKSKDWSKSDELREQLESQGIGLRDMSYGSHWYRT